MQAVRERGLPQVPRGLTRELTLFLQSLLQVVGSVSGLNQGATESRAIRVSESNKFGNNTINADSIGSTAIKDSAVTSSKLASGSVTNDKLETASVTYDKLANDAKLVIKTGSAAHQQTVNIGKWIEPPIVSLQSFSLGLPAKDAASISVSIIGPTLNMDGEWEFMVNCQALALDPADNKSGGINWVAFGRQE